MNSVGQTTDGLLVMQIICVTVFGPQTTIGVWR